MRRLKFPIRFRIRTLLLLTIVFGISFAHLSQVQRVFWREQAAIAKIPNVDIYKPATVSFRQQLVAKSKEFWSKINIGSAASPPNNAWSANNVWPGSGNSRQRTTRSILMEPITMILGLGLCILRASINDVHSIAMHSKSVPLCATGRSLLL